MALRVILQTPRDEAEWTWLLDNVPMAQLLAVERSLGNRKPFVSNYARACRVQVPTDLPAAAPSSQLEHPVAAQLEAFLSSFGGRSKR